MDEPTWVPRLAVDAIHFAQLQEHGGSYGVRDRAALESALDRPKNHFAYRQGADLADLTAAYLFGLAMGHGYADGNKRTAVAVALVFLDLNGYELQRSDKEMVDTAVALASREISDTDVAQWIREALIPKPPPLETRATPIP